MTAAFCAAAPVSGAPTFITQPNEPADLTVQRTYKDGVPWDRTCHGWTLGPAGARGWIWARRRRTGTAPSRQILVTAVAIGEAEKKSNNGHLDRMIKYYGVAAREHVPRLKAWKAKLPGVSKRKNVPDALKAREAGIKAIEKTAVKKKLVTIEDLT